MKRIYLNAFFLLFTINVFAQPGALDMSFGNGGKVITDVGGFPISLVKLQADGKIIVGGTSDSIFLVRHNENGTLDLSFGKDGISKLPLDASLSGMQISTDNKIIIIGTSYLNSPDKPILIHCTSNGKLDSSFGDNGKVILNLIHPPSGALFQPDGKILLYNNKTYADFIIMRLNDDGSMDNSFGSNGKVITDLGGNKTDDFLSKIALQNDAKIVAVGTTTVSATEGNDFALVRYNSNGTLDSTFGNGGIVINDISFWDKWTNLAIQPDGKIVVCGNVNVIPGKTSFIVARYNINGILDSTFGDEGILIADFRANNSDIVNSVILQPDGKIIVGGGTSETPWNENFALARINTDGTLDNTFGDNGIVVSIFTGNERITGLHLSNDNKILANGFADDKIVLAKYESGLPLSLNTANLKNENILLYPNPNNGSFTVSIDNDVLETINVFDMFGRLVSTFVLSDNNTTISLPDNLKGIYFISVQSQKGQFKSKMLIE